MNKERELLESYSKLREDLREDLREGLREGIHTAQELLAQPEPFMFKDRELTGSLIVHDDMYKKGYAQAELDLKREPFGGE